MLAARPPRVESRSCSTASSSGPRAPNPRPVLTNTCYSFVSDKEVIHVASVHAYDAARKTLLVVPGSGGLSDRESELEGVYGASWARNIWADTFS